MTSDLKEIIQTKYLHRGQFVLSSGKTSSMYFDIKSLTVNRDDTFYFYLDFIDFILRNSLDLKAKSLGGLELGGIPLVCGLQFSYNQNDSLFRNICYIRKRARIHGLKKMIEGNPVSPILLIDDVLSTGKTINDAIITCEDNGFTVAGILCVINRYNGESKLVREGLHQKEYPIYSLFTEQDFE